MTPTSLQISSWSTADVLPLSRVGRRWCRSRRRRRRLRRRRLRRRRRRRRLSR